MALIYYSKPYDYYYDRYQAYYVEALKLEAARRGIKTRCISTSWAPDFSRFNRRLRYSSLANKAPLIAAGCDKMSRVLELKNPFPCSSFYPLVGQYMLDDMPFCLDSQDSAMIPSESLLAWSKSYFKTNWRVDFTYDDRVRAIPNLNPQVLGHLSGLRRLRAKRKETDLCCVMRVWGGSNETEGVEHCIRLLESLATVPCKSVLIAYLVAGDIDAQEERLKKAGVHCTRSPIPLKTLWNISSQSRINVIRLGMHQCIPWRTTELLAMGACVMLDQIPLTAWTVPLVPARHFVSLDSRIGDHFLASDEDYVKVPVKIQDLLKSTGLIEYIADEAGQYFDQFLDPIPLGRVLFNMLDEAKRL